MASVGANLMTAEEFYDWANRPENRDRHFELEAGEVVEMSRPGERHGVVCGNATGIFWYFTRQSKQGYVCANDTGLVLERDPDTVRGADVAVYREAAGTLQQLTLKYSPRLPALAIEVLSPNDRIGKMLKRINLFLARGVEMVWLLDPEAYTIAVWRAGQPNLVFEAGEEITGFDIFPDFRCPVADFFAVPGEEIAVPPAYR
jgi:Uma2 family endonuclease